MMLRACVCVCERPYTQTHSELAEQSVVAVESASNINSLIITVQ